MNEIIRSESQMVALRWVCRYDGYPCDRMMRCYGCERMKLDDLENIDAPNKEVAWKPEYGGGDYPVCPSCGEAAYGINHRDENGIGVCPFCGQHYTMGGQAQ